MGRNYRQPRTPKIWKGDFRMTEFNLSEKRKDYRDSHQEPIEWLELKDVKEFIRLLKEELDKKKDWSNYEDKDEVVYFIDKLAGEKLK